MKNAWWIFPVREMWLFSRPGIFRHFKVAVDVIPLKSQMSSWGKKCFEINMPTSALELNLEPFLDWLWAHGSRHVTKLFDLKDVYIHIICREVKSFEIILYIYNIIYIIYIYNIYIIYIYNIYNKYSTHIHTYIDTHITLHYLSFHLHIITYNYI